MRVTKIDRFDGPNRFLSNFWQATVVLDGESYPTVEHAYQAAKTTHNIERQVVRLQLTPGDAKRAGRRVTKRDDWEQVKLSVMLGLLRQKFANQRLAAMLAATGDAELVEGNTWGDRFWGQVDGVGENHLGRLLMQVREELNFEE